MPSPTSTATKTDAILVLLDIVEYTSQSVAQGSPATREFDKYFADELSKRGARYDFHYIKSIGDAALLWGNDPIALVEFALDVFYRDCIPPYKNFDVRLRMIACKDYYEFSHDRPGKVIDVHGAEAIQIFRSEKTAHLNRILVFPTPYSGLSDYAKSHGFTITELTDFAPFKGMAAKTPRALYILRPPLQPGSADKEFPAAFRDARDQLRELVQNIPVFGELYPTIPMSQDFLNLSLDRQKTDGPSGYYKFDIPNFEDRMGIDRDGHRRAPHAEREHLPNFDRIGATDLFKYVRKAVIAGVPGAGKTTILRHFAFRALADEECATIVLVEAKHLIPGHLTLVSQGNIYEIHNILTVATALFLYPHQDPVTFDADQHKTLASTAATLLDRWENGLAIILFDALDEATGKDQRQWLASAAATLMAEIPDAKTPAQSLALRRHACFLTLRVAELGSYYFPRIPVFLVNSLEYGQITDIALRQFGGDTSLHKQFGKDLLLRSDIQNIAGTPLTAMLMVFYYQVYKKFDTRFAIYRLLLCFILARSWDRIKQGTIGDKGTGMDAFFEAVQQPDYLQQNPEVGLQFHALGYTATCILFENDSTRKGSNASSNTFAGSSTVFCKGCGRIARKN